jgi:hypothetical protein
MARQRTILETFTCDVCGAESPEVTTVTLGWGKDQWELDLCEKDNAAVSKTFDSWIENGRKVSRRTRGAASSSGVGDTAAIREWALANKMNVAPRGRISAEVREAYVAAKK